MKLLYIGCFVSPQQESLFISNKTKVTIATTSFQKMFLSGFKDVAKKPFIINAADIGSWPKRSGVFKIPASVEFFKGMTCRNVGFTNLTLYKQHSIYKSLLCEGYNWANQYKKEKKVIIVYSLIYSYLKVAIDIKKQFSGTKVCCIVLDLPQFFNDKSSLLFKIIDKTSRIYEISKEIDSFILLTEQMTIPLKVGKRPWILMEGVYNPTNILSKQKSKKTILYTGKLDSRFGIRNLLDSFSSVKDKDAKLWICGDGVDKEYVIQGALSDKRITYYGVKSQVQIFKLQKEATLLINPRKPEGEYTKYSFPSKTMEYMASGTPTLMYRLPGMPEEYEPYVVLFKDSTDEEMTRTMEIWLNKPQEELDNFGAKASAFIMKNKTADVQISRFLNFLKNTYGE